MEYLKSIKPREWLYIGGAVASLIALAFVFGSRTNPGPGVQTDTPNPVLGEPESAGPGYTTYNTGPVNPTPLSAISPDEMPAGNCGCGSPSAYGCAGPSQLDDGGAYSSNSQLYSFLQSINPNFIEAQQEQLNTYAEYFAQGSSYAGGTVTGQVIN